MVTEWLELEEETCSLKLIFLYRNIVSVLILVIQKTPVCITWNCVISFEIAIIMIKFTLIYWGILTLSLEEYSWFFKCVSFIYKASVKLSLIRSFSCMKKLTFKLINNGRNWRHELQLIHFGKSKSSYNWFIFVHVIFRRVIFLYIILNVKIL